MYKTHSTDPYGGQYPHAALFYQLHHAAPDTPTDTDPQAPPARDLLTGVLDRTAFERALVQIQQERTAPVSLLLADINGLSTVNQRSGRGQGDSMLRRTAQVLERVCPPSTTLARIDGDEFAALLWNTPPDRVRHLEEQITQECLRQTAPGALPVHVSCVSVFRDSPDMSTDRLYQLAEERLQAHKLLNAHSAHSQLPLTLREVMALRHVETADHMRRMEETAHAMADALDLPPGERERLVLLAALHDVGKVAVPDHILTRPGPLTLAEFLIIQGHSEAGWRLAQSSPALASIAAEIRGHHERWDGTGYPDGLSGEEIPLLARILALLDTWDVMTHARVYKDPVPPQLAAQELLRCAGTQFDPVLVKAFLKALAGVLPEAG